VRLTSCPGCGEIEGVAQTRSAPRVAVQMRNVLAISLVNHEQHSAYFDRLAATVEHLGATRSVLRAVITLADDTVTLPDKELRDRLLA
jgi:hypothetical protein